MSQGISLNPSGTLQSPSYEDLQEYDFVTPSESHHLIHDKLYREESSQEVFYNDPGFWKTTVVYDLPQKKLLENIVDSLTQDKQNLLHEKVYTLSSSPDNSDPEWGKHHLFDHLPTLILALIELKFLHYEQVIGRNIENYYKYLESPPLESRGELLKSEMGRRELTGKKHKKEINYSVSNRSDLNFTIALSPDLKERIGIFDPNILKGRVTLMKNSPLNGRVFKNERGEYEAITDAVSSSNDKTVKHTLNGRVANNYNGESVCYSGKLDLLSIAKEQAKFMFLNELHSSKKGQVQKGEIVEQTYVVQSLLSPSGLTKYDEFDEKGSTLTQEKALKELSKQPIEITDPLTGNTHLVVFKPLFFVQPFNGFSLFETILPDYLTGKGIASRISKEGLEQLKTHADQETLKLVEKLEKEEKNYLPEEAVLCHIHLAQELKLPINVHCKSSVDRTSLGVAMTQALEQWKRAGNEIPHKDYTFDPKALLKNPLFKELIAANIMVGHQLTSIARSGEGIVNGKPMKSQNLGFSWTRKLLPMPVPPRILPERYSKAPSIKRSFTKFAINPLIKKVPKCPKALIYVAAAIIGFVSSIFAFIALECIGFAFKNPVLGFTAATKLPKVFSTPEFDEDASYVGYRHLVGPPGAIAPE
ncbi:MAG: hypothetical protein KAR79_02730 [Simkaniaceae bacterium]|nr:hypothetical protein [Simkaniaceae bacterium]